MAAKSAAHWISLIQELHREANTLGSKSAVLEMSRIAVDMKVLIEQLREQCRTSNSARHPPDRSLL